MQKLRTHLRQLMMQKVKRSAEQHGTDPAEGEKFVDDIIAKFEKYGFLDDKAYAEMLGVNDYIRKPFSMDRLIDAVNRLIQRESDG